MLWRIVRRLCGKSSHPVARRVVREYVSGMRILHLGDTHLYKWSQVMAKVTDR